MASWGSTGGVTAGEIAEEAQSMDATAEASASPLARFSRRISQLVIGRFAQGDTGQFSVFLLSEDLHMDAKRWATSEKPMLSSCNDPIGDRVWLSTCLMQHSYELSLTWSDEAALFEEIRKAGFGSFPAVIVDWRGDVPVGKVYRQGIVVADAEPVHFDEAPVCDAEMKQVLDCFYNRSIRTPALSSEGHANKIWEDASKGIPKPRPEEIIQGRLLDALRMTFGTRHIRAEQITDDGRADLTMYSKTKSQNNLPAIVYEWLLELKAFCDMTANGTASTTSVPNALRGGIHQVVAYADELNAVNKALCCFDMRKTDVGDAICFADVSQTAADEGIHLWRWFIFRSTPTSRTKKVEAKLAAA